MLCFCILKRIGIATLFSQLWILNSVRAHSRDLRGLNSTGKMIWETLPHLLGGFSQPQKCSLLRRDFRRLAVLEC